MNILARLNISTKILLLLLMLGMVTVAIAFAGSRSILTADNANTVMVDKFPATVDLARGNRRAVEMVYAGYRVLVYPGASRTAQDAAAAEQTAYESAKDKLGLSASADPALASNVADLVRDLDALHGVLRRAVQFGLADNHTEALASLAQADALLVEFDKQIVSVNDKRLATNQSASDALSAAARSHSLWLLVFSLAGVVVSVGTSLAISRVGITGPLARLKATMQALADGNNSVAVDGADRGDEVGAMAKVVLVFRETAIAKAAADADKAAAEATVQLVVETLGANLAGLNNRDLTGRVTADYPGVYAVLKANYNQALDSVEATVRQVSDSSANIRTGSDEIARAAEDLARRTEGNAASLEQTSAALVQIDTRIKATASASLSTVARADQAMATVGSGRTTAQSAKLAMDRVSGSAKGIDSVIEGLDKIAFQTRVLAMNAAVEAGRAGESGRGFAVVADLVSALAMRAEEEAKRARDQLTVTQAEIITAVAAVEKVDVALSAISGDVSEVNALLAGMATDNQAQSEAITEIAAAVASMDRSTQQNAAMVEETSAAARNLTQEVGTLAAAAAQFNVDNGGRAVAADRAAHVPAVAATAPPRRPAPPRAKPVRAAVASAPAAGGGEWAEF